MDRENLPYVNAIVKEVLRIYPSLPLGVPHVTTVEDEYKGMRIPKGSVVIPNVWYVLVPRSRLWLDFSNCWMHDRGMARDKDVYGSDTDVFRPERFIEGELRDSDGIVFGFGRRYFRRSSILSKRSPMPFDTGFVPGSTWHKIVSS